MTRTASAQSGTWLCCCLLESRPPTGNLAARHPASLYFPPQSQTFASSIYPNNFFSFLVLINSEANVVVPYCCQPWQAQRLATRA